MRVLAACVKGSGVSLLKIRNVNKILKCEGVNVFTSQFRLPSVRKKTRVSTRGQNSFSEKNLAHTRWNCKVHIIFTPKYRRKVIHGKLRVSISQIVRKL